MKKTNLYMVYELNVLSRSHTNNFTLKNCLFRTVKLTRNAGKSKFNHKGWVTAFHGKSVWSYGNDFGTSVVICGVDNTSSSHTINKDITF